MLGSIFNIGDTISFQVYPSVLLGNQFNDVVVQSVVNADTARMLGFDFVSMHANVFPTLPESSPDNPNQYNYLVVRLQSGGTQIVGLPWIREETIVSRVTTSVFVEIIGAGTVDVPAIVNALSSNGYRSNNVKVGDPSNS